MSKKRFWWSVFAVFGVVFITNWLFHGIWLSPLYQQTAQFWRPFTEMQKMMPIMWLGDFIFSWAFVWIYSKGISNGNLWSQAFRYACAVLLLTQIPQQLGMWVTSPYPSELVLRWCFIGIVQAMLCAFVMTWTYNPKALLQKRAA